MKTLWFMFQTSFSTLGAVLGFFLGGLDGFLYALIAFVVADYISGVLAAISEKRLSSSVGFKGIARKILIFTLVGLANLLDVYVIGAGQVLRTATIFFYLSNEGISLLENTTRLGLPVPEQLRDTLAALTKHEASGSVSENRAVTSPTRAQPQAFIEPHQSETN